MRHVPVMKKKPGVLVTQKHDSIRVRKALGAWGVVSPAAGHAGAVLRPQDCPGPGPQCRGLDAL